MKKSKSAPNSRKEKQRKSDMKFESSASTEHAESAPTKRPKQTKVTKGAAAQSNYGHASGKPDTRPIELISLGNKRPEGIAKGPGDYMFVTEMLYGGVKKVNVLTGEVEQVVPSYGFLERGASGVTYYENALFVAGGGSPIGTPVMLYVYNAETGEEIASCAPVGNEYHMLTDVTIVGDSVYVTDSRLNKLMVVNVKAAMDGDCVVEYVETPAEYFVAATPAEAPRANGKKENKKSTLHCYIVFLEAL